MSFFLDELQVFAKRLKCNTDCEKMEKGSAEREQCEKENCIEIPDPVDPDEIEDEYDYSYGDETDDEDNEVEVQPRS